MSRAAVRAFAAINIPSDMSRQLIAAAVFTLVLARSGAAQDRTAEARTLARSFTGVSYALQSFTSDIAPWHFGSASVGTRDSAGTYIARINYARRFGSAGVQGEIEAYPRFTDHVYGYLDFGYSRDGVFPEWRTGAELFTSLPDAYEGSLGYRQFRFKGGDPVTLLTGSLGKYAGNYWFSLRPYVRSLGDDKSVSASLYARRYYEDGDHYVGARVGVGSTPSDQLAPDQAVVRTNSFSAAVQGSTSITTSMLGIWSGTYERERLGPAVTRSSVAVEAGIRVFF